MDEQAAGGRPQGQAGAGQAEVVYGGGVRLSVEGEVRARAAECEHVPGIGPGGTAENASWYGVGNWFLRSIIQDGDFHVLSGVWRAEVFRDNNGARTGYADTFYETTLGLIYRPRPWLWVRPEARYDWAEHTHPL